MNNTNQHIKIELIEPKVRQARALAALLASTGKRALFYPAPAGFTVAEVAA